MGDNKVEFVEASGTQSHYSEPPPFVAFTGINGRGRQGSNTGTGKGCACVTGSYGDRISRRVDSEQDLNWVLFPCRRKQPRLDSGLL